jgi:hypothetical protein
MPLTIVFQEKFLKLFKTLQENRVESSSVRFDDDCECFVGIKIKKLSVHPFNDSNEITTKN